MTYRLSVCGIALLFVAIASASARAQYAVQNPTDITVIDATTVLTQSMQMQQNEIPRPLLANAQAIAIVPGMIRGAFVFGLQHGRGVLVIRDVNGAWQAPRMIQITGGSIGYQIGVQATDLILVFRTQQSVQRLLQGTLKIGVDASAAAGPVGRQTSAGTDVSTAAAILSYSRARGAFIGVSIDGSAISLDPGAEAIYYQPPGAFPASAAQLMQVINAYTAATPMAVAAVPGTIPGTIPAAPPAPPAAGTAGWMPAGQHSAAGGTSGAGDTETARQQLDLSSRQLSATLDPSWRQYLALPQEVYCPNQVPNPQATQQSLQRYEAVAKDPQYTALQANPNFQQTLVSLRRMGEVRTASSNAALPPPPPLK